jgi:pimeloyl-ACP methyl ester carboxylesterase
MPRIAVDGIGLHYRTAGEGPNAVLFLHGFCQSSRFWEEALGRLPAGYRGFALDLKGFGDSDKPPGPYGIPVFADEVVGFASALGLDRFALVGNSMGGVVCQSLATRYPFKLTRLVLVSTGPYARNPEGARERAGRFASMAWDREPFREMVRGFFHAPPDAWESLVDVAMEARREAMVGSTRSSASLNFLPAMRSVTVPTLIVQGERDASRTPEDGRELHEAVRGSRFHVLEGAGHTPQLERPDLFYPPFTDFLSG